MISNSTNSLNQSVQGDFTAINHKIESDCLNSKPYWDQFQTEASLDVRTESGDVNLLTEMNNAGINLARPTWFFNETRPLMSTVSGRQRQTRKSSYAAPLENADQETADQLTKILLGIYNRENLYETISEAFHEGACLTGLCLIQMYLDFRNDPVNGDLKFRRLSYNQIYMDPMFRDSGLSDCRFIMTQTYMSHAEAASLMPEQYYDDIMKLPGNPMGSGTDTIFRKLPESLGRKVVNSVAYDEYYYRDFRKAKFFYDRDTGECLEVTNKDDLDIERFLYENPQVILDEKTVPTVRMAIRIQKKVFYDGVQPINGLDCFPMVPIIGFYNHMLPTMAARIQGLVRSCRDAQMLLNYQYMQQHDLIASQLSSGWIFKENAVIDIKHLFQTGHGRVIPLKADGPPINESIQQIPPAQIPPSHFQLIESNSRMLNKVTGIGEELQGSAEEKTISGVLGMLRQWAGVVSLQPLFDRLDSSQKRLSDMMVIAVQNNYTPGKIQLLLEGEKPAPLFYNKAFGKYHCLVEDGITTSTQKQMSLGQKIQLKEMGYDVDIEDIIEDMAMQKKDRFIENIRRREEEAGKMQQMEMQIKMQEAEARIKLANARAVADEGLGYERYSRVEENQALAVERRAQAHKDDEEALFTKIKMLKEIEDLDIGHLERLVNIAQALKEKTEEPKPKATQ